MYTYHSHVCACVYVCVYVCEECCRVVLYIYAIIQLYCIAVIKLTRFKK